MHDTWWGDPAYTGEANATLGPLDTASVLCGVVRPGTLGTKGGPQTDVNGQVLDVDGQVLDVDGRPQPMRRGPLHRLADARSPIRRDDSIQAHIDEMGSAQIRSASTNGR